MDLANRCNLFRYSGFEYAALAASASRFSLLRVRNLNVYTKVIYELNQRYGINKFIIVVPSLAIKAGTAQFLCDDYVRRHFSDSCGYGTEIELGVLEAVKAQKNKRSCRISKK